MSENSILDILNNRSIRYLVHFTPLDNINSILEKGLYSRGFIEESEAGIFEGNLFTDEFRLENMKEGICLSITFPNDKMFYIKRRDAKKGIQWGVVLIDANIIANLSCRFFPTNAALKDFRIFNETYFEGAAALNRMFCNELETSKQKIMREPYLLDKDTTCVQAEVMVLQHIPVEYIRGCIFDSNQLKEHYSNIYTDFTFESCEGYYNVFDERKTARNKNFTGP
jgi:hypothetical protein